MSVKSTIVAVALISAIIAPMVCFAQGGGGAGGAGGGASGVEPPATPGGGGTTRTTRPELSPPPFENSDMTWDGNRLRLNDRSQSHPVYQRPRTALTPFDVNPFRTDGN
jgi:hypothetical protein